MTAIGTRGESLRDMNKLAYSDHQVLSTDPTFIAGIFFRMFH
jgi:hypothetical protein